jgi:flagellar hook-length control protein FliK
VQVNLVQTQTVANPVVPANEAKAAVNALVELAMPEKNLNLEARPVQATLEASATTAEGQVIDSALNEQPAAHLLASVERSQVTNGVATQSGAAVSLAPGYNQGDASTGGDGRRPAPEVGEVTRLNTEASAASFDRFLGQKLEAQAPVAATYNAQGRIPTPTEQVDISIRQLANSGGGEVRIKLSPEELGRVDIRLEIHNSQVRGVILVERPEVMQDLARDLKQLQQALTASGLTMADNALSFQMQNQGGDQGQEQNNSSNRGGLTEVAGVDDSGLPLPVGPWRDVTKLVDVNI